MQIEVIYKSFTSCKWPQKYKARGKLGKSTSQLRSGIKGRWNVSLTHRFYPWFWQHILILHRRDFKDASVFIFQAYFNLWMAVICPDGAGSLWTSSYIDWMWTSSLYVKLANLKDKARPVCTWLFWWWRKIVTAPVDEAVTILSWSKNCLKKGQR